MTFTLILQLLPCDASYVNCIDKMATRPVLSVLPQLSTSVNRTELVAALKELEREKLSGWSAPIKIFPPLPLFPFPFLSPPPPPLPPPSYVSLYLDKASSSLSVLPLYSPLTLSSYSETRLLTLYRKILNLKLFVSSVYRHLLLSFACHLSSIADDVRR